jgi:hypothetical protein
MTLTLSAPGNPHPAVVQMFSGWGTPYHIALGFAAGLIDEPMRSAIFAAFTGYQISQVGQGQSWASTGGELIEFAIGLALAALTRLK